MAKKQLTTEQIEAKLKRFYEDLVQNRLVDRVNRLEKGEK